MPQEISPGLYRLEVPLAGSPLKALNAYVITGGDRNLIIDTGFNRPECLAAITADLEALDLDRARTDFFITHLHADHTGLIGALKTDASRLYCSAVDGEGINTFNQLTTDDPYFHDIADFTVLSGFSPLEAREAIARHPGFRYGPPGQFAFTSVADGDTLTFGDYRFTCMATPGHTAGHMCLYEPKRKLLLSGDHILGDITPNISAMQPTGNPLAAYLVSLEAMATLEVDLVLPGHRRPFTGCRQRIAELIAHHYRRAGEVLAILADGPLPAYQVAARMTWDLTYDTWEEVASPQKWFAVGEALAHLRYLEGEAKVGSRREGDHIIYRLA